MASFRCLITTGRAAATIQIKKIDEEEFLRIRELKRIKFQTNKVVYDDFHHHPIKF